MLKVTIILCIFPLFLSNLLEKFSEFKNYMKEYDKRYANRAVELYRFFIYLDNLQVIAQLNIED